MDNTDITWQNLGVNRQVRAKMKSQTPCVIWFTGLSGAGKSSIADAVEKQLALFGQHTYLLDGDHVRHGLCRDLGFSGGHRQENIRRVGEVANLMVDAGLIVLCAFISPFRHGRDTIRSQFKQGEFIEVYVDVPIDECEKRDSKGLYKKARGGFIQDFTGIDSPYEVPINPEMVIRNYNDSIESAAQMVIQYLKRQGYISAQS